MKIENYKLKIRISRLKQNNIWLEKIQNHQAPKTL